MKFNIRHLLLLTALAAIFCGSVVRAKLNKNAIERSPLFFPQPLNSNFANQSRPELIKPNDNEAKMIQDMLSDGDPLTEKPSDQ